MAHLYAGTSGFAYTTWKPDFYPQKLPQKNFLQHYATRLNAVEINYTFRRLPSAPTLEGWVAHTPAEFQFCIKAHQRITHIQRLKTSEFTNVFFSSIDSLRSSGRLGAVLFQLPPNLKCDTVLLGEFLETLPRDVRCAFEFRNTGWLTDEVYSLLQQRGAALCLAESDKLEIPRVLTAGFVYSRLRKSEYSDEERQEITAGAREMLDTGRDLFVFFKHESTPAGARYAEALVAAIRSPASESASSA
jgi:uncharacterized protein YecE (DUF72 family)